MDLKEIFYIIVLIFVFYTFGLVISNIVNVIFPKCDYKKKNKYILLETILQLAIVYGFFIFLNKKLRNIVDKIFRNVTKHKINDLLLTIIVVAFSSGVFRHLDELKLKIEYLKKLILS